MADKEYIDRKAALLAITNTGCTAANVEELMKVPIADVVEVRHGYNVKRGTPSLFECSECGWSDCDTYTGESVTYNYCPNCGAKMEDGDDGRTT